MRQILGKLAGAFIVGASALTLTGCILPPPLPADPTLAAPTTPSSTASETPAATPSAPSPIPQTPAAAPTPAADPGPDLATFAALNERDFALLARDPDAHLGDQLIVTGVVSQFDAATGRCGFLAQIGHDRMANSYDYGQNSAFTAGDGFSDCAVLDDVVEDDHVRLWVTALGSYSYDTQIGGNTTVPFFEVHKVEQLPRQEY